MEVDLSPKRPLRDELHREKYTQPRCPQLLLPEENPCSVPRHTAWKFVHGCCLHPIGQFTVTWLGLAARDAGKQTFLRSH
jgi:hypothetical protein